MQNERPRAVYGGFFVRLSAFLIDSLLVGLLTLAVSLPISILCNVLPGDLGNQAILFRYTLKDILRYLVGAGYFILLTYTTGKTVGKKAMNLRVINADGTLKLSLFNVIFRETVGRFLSAFVLCLGYLMAGIDSDKRALHDRLCDTRVIYEKEIGVKYIRKEVKGRPDSENEKNLSPEMRTGGYSYQTESGNFMEETEKNCEDQ